MQAATPSREILEILRRLRSIESEIRELRKRVERLEASTRKTPRPPKAIENMLELPDSLRKTMSIMAQLEEAPAEAIAKQTHRTRGMESIYLNQLTRMGYVQKIKSGRKIHFRTHTETKADKSKMREHA